MDVKLVNGFAYYANTFTQSVKLLRCTVTDPGAGSVSDCTSQDIFATRLTFGPGGTTMYASHYLADYLRAAIVNATGVYGYGDLANGVAGAPWGVLYAG